MSDNRKADPDDDLLEFLGDIDALAGESQDEDFSDYLANTDIDKVAGKPQAPAKDGKRE